MEIIYIDQLIFINFIIDYFTLLCTAKVASVVIRRIPIALAAALGGAYAGICVLPGWSFMLHPLIKSAVAVLMCLIAFGREAHLFRDIVIFFLVSAGFGGLVWAVSMFGGYDLSGKTLYLPLNWKILALSFAVSYVVISALFRRFADTAQQELSEVQITLNQRTIHFRALRDTGNSLFDPITNCSVLVCERTCLAKLFEGTEINFQEDPAAMVEYLSRQPGLTGRMRLIPFNSVGGSGLLAAFRPDALSIGGKPIENTLVAFTDNKLSTYGQYQGIY